MNPIPDSSAEILSEFFVSEDEHSAMVDALSGGAQGDRAAAADIVLEMLAFRLANECYAVSIEQIREIIKVPEITPVPRVADSILGVLSLRGAIVPILDMRRALRLEEGELERTARIVVIGNEDDPVGLLVDCVLSVVRLHEADIEAAPSVVRQAAGDIVTGVGRTGDDMFILLDGAGLLSLLERES